MNNKGFTMVELLAVILLISVMAIIFIPGIVNIRNSTNADVENSRENTIKLAGEDYGNDRINDYQKCTSNGISGCCVKVSELINKNYLEDDEAQSTADINLKAGSIYLTYNRNTIKVTGRFYKRSNCTN